MGRRTLKYIKNCSTIVTEYWIVDCENKKLGGNLIYLENHIAGRL